MDVELLLARAELYERADPTAQWLAYIKAERIDARDCCPHCGLLAVTPCAFFSSRFDFAAPDEADAEPAAVIECLGDDGATIIDLCAWPLADPTRFAIMFGTAFALGIERVDNPATYFAGQHLQLYRTPLRWLQAGCDGAVILDQASAHLSDEALALAFTAEHGDELRYVAAWNRWFRWDGTRWAHEPTLLAFDLARAICRDAAEGASKETYRQGRHVEQDRRRRGGVGARRPATRRDRRSVGRRSVAAQHAGRHGRSGDRTATAASARGLLHQDHRRSAGRPLPAVAHVS